MHRPLLRAMSRWLDVGESPQHADYVLVLNGSLNTRPFVTAALIKADMARQALITQISPLMGNPFLPPSDVINRDVLLARGIAPDDVRILPAAATTTYDEAQALAAFLKEHTEARVLIVTDASHTRRSHWVFAKALGRQSEQVSFVSAPADQYGPDDWWRDEAGFLAITTEYLKLVFYVVYYGYFGYWLLACGGLITVAAWIWRSHSYRSASIGSKREAFQAG